MNIDFSFDERIARRYKAQREHPPDVSDQIGAAIAKGVGVGKLILEIGVGNGRIAQPVLKSGCHVMGLDISADMLAEVAGSSPGLSLFQGDMHSIPLKDHSVDAILAVHVLHLADNLERVISEGIRVLKPEGIVIQGEDWVDPESVFGQLRDALRQKALALNPDLSPPSATISPQQILTELGGDQVSEFVAAEWTTWLSPNERLAAIENRMDNESWFLPEAIFNPLLQQLKEFAAEKWPDLNEKQPVLHRFQIKVTSGGW